MGYLGPRLRRVKRRERPLRRVVVAVVVSLAANLLMLWGLVAAGAFRLAQPAQSARVALAPLSASEWAANRAIAGAQPKPVAPPPPDERLSGKIVELSPQQKASERAPDRAKFLSDRNTRVEKETVSRYAGVYPRLAPKPEAGASGKPSPPQAPAGRRGERGGKDAAVPGREGTPGQRVASRPGGELRMPELGESGDRGRHGAEGADLSVSHEALQRIAGGPNMDGVGEDLPQGEETWLQAREFKYATYMNRMRDAIGQQWYPRVRQAAQDRDPDGKLWLGRERTVVLTIVLDTEGNLKDMSVLQSSTLDFFDRVAMVSVQAAQPFPNPPAGMFHAETTVRIPFSFTMYPADRHGGIFWRVPTP